MVLSLEDIQAIQSHGRRFGVAVEVLAQGNWCSISKKVPDRMQVGFSAPPDHGVNRVRSIGKIRIQVELETGLAAARPTSLVVRNDDGLFSKTSGLYLHNNSFKQWLPTWKRARVRIRIHPPEDPSAIGIILAQYYIATVRPTDGPEAVIQLQPREKILLKANPETVRQGDRWHRDIDAGELGRLLVVAADPNVVFEAGSPPRRVYIDVRPNVGNAIDGMGRQPEKMDGELTFNRDEVPTAIVEGENTDTIYYATYSTVDSKPHFYKYTISTGESERFWSGVEHSAVSTLINDANLQIVMIAVSLRYPDDMSDRYNRTGRGYTHTIGSSSATQRWGTDLFPVCDAFIPSYLPGGADFTATIGILKAGERVNGEPISIGFPQQMLAWWDPANPGMDTYDVVPGSERSLQQTSLPIEYGGIPTDEENVGSEKRSYDHTGWTHGYRVNYFGEAYHAWYHLNAHAYPMKFAENYGRLVGVRWQPGYGGRWEVWRTKTDGTSTDSTRILFPYSTSQQLRLAQPTGFCVVNTNGDPHLGSVNWLILATIQYRRTGQDGGSNVYAASIWKIELNIQPSGDQYTVGDGLTELITWNVLDMDDNEEWLTYLDFEFMSGPNRAQIIGCAFDRKSRVYRAFDFNLEFNTYSSKPMGPKSGSPLVGFREVEGRMYFRDCGTGILWSAGEYLADDVRLEGNGQSVSENDLWEATGRLAVVGSGADKRVMGFAAPSSQIWAWPYDADQIPRINPVGGFQLWSLANKVSVRVPIADFSEIKDTGKALEYIAQACGPGYVHAYNELGEWYLKKRSTGLGDFALIPRTEGGAVGGHREVTAHNVSRPDSEGEDFQNAITITPHVAEHPPVSVRAELVPRQGDDADSFTVAIAAASHTDAPRRVILNCTRAGTVGPLDTSLTGLTSDWDSTLLFSYVHNASDVTTRLKENATDYDTIAVEGMSRAPSGLDLERMIFGTLVRAQKDGFEGDFISVGESGTGRVVAFFYPNIIVTEGLGTPPQSIPRGTVVRIQQALGSYDEDATNAAGLIVRGGMNASDDESAIKIANHELVRAGDVIMVQKEALLVLEKYQDWGNPWFEDGYTHEILVQRAYLGTKKEPHLLNAGPYHAPVFLHPTAARPYLLGDTKISVSFSADPGAAPATRSFRAGDRIVLDYPGTRSAPSQHVQGVAEGVDSQKHYGERVDWKIKDNPFVSSLVAPHLAYAWLEALQWSKLPFEATINFAPEVKPTTNVAMVSERMLPDELANTKVCQIQEIGFDLKNWRTTLALISILGATTDAAPSAGHGAPSKGGF